MFIGLRPFQDMPGNLVAFPGVTYADTHTQKIGPDVADHIAQTIVTAVPAALFQTQRADRKIDFVMHDQHLLWLYPMVGHRGLHTLTAEIHIGRRLEQSKIVLIYLHTGNIARKSLFRTERRAGFFGQSVDQPETHIVTVTFVF